MLLCSCQSSYDFCCWLPLLLKLLCNTVENHTLECKTATTDNVVSSFNGVLGAPGCCLYVPGQHPFHSQRGCFRCLQFWGVSYSSRSLFLLRGAYLLQRSGIMCVEHAAAAAAKSLQSCPTLCNPINGSPPGSAVPGILQARTLEWVAISFSSA